jgi:hypothetical protein
MTRAVPLGLLFVRPNYAKGIHVFCCAVCYRRGFLLDVNLFYLFPIYHIRHVSIHISPLTERSSSSCRLHGSGIFAVETPHTVCLRD